MEAVTHLLWSHGALMLVCTVTIALRILVKHRRGRPIRNDDYTVIGAWVFLVVSLTSIVVATRHGYGQHIADLQSSPAKAVKLVAVSQFFALTAGAVAKTAMAMMLLKVLDVRWQRMFTWGLVISANLVIWCFAIFLWVVIWENWVVDICFGTRGVWRFAIFGAVWSALTDFAFAFLPWLFIWHLNRRRAQKISLGVAMSFGVVSGAIAIAKVTQMDCKTVARDVTHDTVALVIWTFAEPVAIIIAASIPVLRHFIETPAQAAFERGRMGTHTRSGVPLDFAYPSSARYERRAKIWSTGDGQTDTSIALQTLNSRDGILRTDDVRVNIEETRTASPQRSS